jgi:hypothetical protein
MIGTTISIVLNRTTSAVNYGNPKRLQISIFGPCTVAHFNAIRQQGQQTANILKVDSRTLKPTQNIDRSTVSATSSAKPVTTLNYTVSVKINATEAANSVPTSQRQTPGNKKFDSTGNLALPNSLAQREVKLARVYKTPYLPT